MNHMHGGTSNRILSHQPTLQNIYSNINLSCTWWRAVSGVQKLYVECFPITPYTIFAHKPAGFLKSSTNDPSFALHTCFKSNKSLVGASVLNRHKLQLFKLDMLHNGLGLLLKISSFQIRVVAVSSGYQVPRQLLHVRAVAGAAQRHSIPWLGLARVQRFAAFHVGQLKVPTATWAQLFVTRCLVSQLIFRSHPKVLVELRGFFVAALSLHLLLLLTQFPLPLRLSSALRKP
mmetsp:Transcript_29667/g.57027  ORF Transcript_29667/g.57027 Transcript_29667/m.57027 type:complete len:232 (-) Transcript_29667:292-987(-)